MSLRRLEALLLESEPILDIDHQCQGRKKTEPTAGRWSMGGYHLPRFWQRQNRV